MTIIKAINVGEVTEAVMTMLQDHPDVGNSGADIERSGEPPDDPGPKGWIGLYRNRTTFPTRALGYGAGYRDQNIRLCLHVRMSNFESPDGCENDIEALVASIVGCLLSDETLKGTVDNLSQDVEVQYPDQLKAGDDDDAYWIQVANIFFEAQTTVKEG